MIYKSIFKSLNDELNAQSVKLALETFCSVGYLCLSHMSNILMHINYTYDNHILYDKIQ